MPVNTRPRRLCWSTSLQAPINSTKKGDMHQVYQYLIPMYRLERSMSKSDRLNITIRLFLMRQINPMSTPYIMVRAFLCIECISHFGSLIMSVTNKHMSYSSSPTMKLVLLCGHIIGKGITVTLILCSHVTKFPLALCILKSQLICTFCGLTMSIQ